MPDTLALGCHSLLNDRAVIRSRRASQNYYFGSRLRCVGSNDCLGMLVYSFQSLLPNRMSWFRHTSRFRWQSRSHRTCRGQWYDVLRTACYLMILGILARTVYYTHNKYSGSLYTYKGQRLPLPKVIKHHVTEWMRMHTDHGATVGDGSVKDCALSWRRGVGRFIVCVALTCSREWKFIVLDA